MAEKVSSNILKRLQEKLTPEEIKQLENLQKEILADYFRRHKGDIITWRKTSESLATSIKFSIFIGIPSGLAVAFLANSIFSILNLDAFFILLISLITLIGISFFGHSLWKEAKEEAETWDAIFHDSSQAYLEFERDKILEKSTVEK